MSIPAVRLGAALADRYRVERELGAGGMATVYLAEDVKHRRKVALKMVHPELSAVLGPERFLKEIELTASLQHPHMMANSPSRDVMSIDRTSDTRRGPTRFMTSRAMDAFSSRRTSRRRIPSFWCATGSPSCERTADTERTHH